LEKEEGRGKKISAPTQTEDCSGVGEEEEKERKKDKFGGNKRNSVTQWRPTKAECCSRVGEGGKGEEKD